MRRFKSDEEKLAECIAEYSEIKASIRRKQSQTSFEAERLYKLSAKIAGLKVRLGLESCHEIKG